VVNGHVMQRLNRCMTCSVSSLLTFLNQSTFEAVAMMLQKTALGRAGLTSSLSTALKPRPLEVEMALSAVCRNKFRRQFCGCRDRPGIKMRLSSWSYKQASSYIIKDGKALCTWELITCCSCG
jgi:hypothetical protein